MDTDKLITRLGELSITWGLNLAGVLVVLVASVSVANRVREAINRRLERRRFEPSLTRFFASLARYRILIGAAVGACLGASQTVGDESVTVQVVAGETDFVIVDGYAAAAGAFQLTASCP